MSSLESAFLMSPQSLSGKQLSAEVPARLGVMASGSGSNFEAIARAIEKGDLKAQIVVVVYNNPDAKVVQRAERLGIPSRLLNHRTFESREALDDAIAEVMNE